MERATWKGTNYPTEQRTAIADIAQQLGKERFLVLLADALQYVGEHFNGETSDDDEWIALAYKIDELHNYSGESE